MTPAELKTLRESIGLTAQWLANQVGVKLRSVQYWESGRSPVPNDVSSLLSRIDDNINYSVNQAVSHINAVVKQQGAAPESITLIRYRSDSDLWQFRPDMKPLPTTTHAALLSRLRRELNLRNINNKIIFMEAEAYKLWLGERKDDESTRSEWAAQKD